MEIRYVDADHGFAAFAPSACPSQGACCDVSFSSPKAEEGKAAKNSGTSAGVGECRCIAFAPGAVVADELPVVAWQQMLSRAPLTGANPKVCANADDGNAAAEGRRSDSTPPAGAGAGIHRSCALCLASLLSVSEEAERLASLCGDNDHQSEGDDSLRRLFLKVVEERGLFRGDGNSCNSPTSYDCGSAADLKEEGGDAKTKATTIDWSKWFMVATEEEVPPPTASPTRLRSVRIGGCDTGGGAAHYLALRPIAEQRHVVVCPPHANSNEVSGRWTLSFCGDKCLKGFDEQFGLKRWLLGSSAATRGTAVASSLLSPPAPSTVDEGVRSLLSRYLLFEAIPSGNSDDSNTDPNQQLFATAAERECLWSRLVNGYIKRTDAHSCGCGVCCELSQEEEEEEEGSRRAGSVDTSSSKGGKRAYTSSFSSSFSSPSSPAVANLRLQRALMAIATLSGTFNERYYAMLLLICRALTAIASKAGAAEQVSKNEEKKKVRPFSLRIDILPKLDDYLSGDALCAAYEEGPFRRQTWRQREALRSFCALVNEWLEAIAAVEEAEGEREEVVAGDGRGREGEKDEHSGGGDVDSSSFSKRSASSPNDDDPPTRRYISVQTLQAMAMVLDANSHACVVVNPIYAALFASKLGGDGEGSDSAEKGVHEGAADSSSAAAEVHIVLSSAERLRRVLLFGSAADSPTITDGQPSSSPSTTEPRESEAVAKSKFCRRLHRLPPSLHHNLGVAFYDRCTKINHSCRPNVKFVPTFAPARAVVVARPPFAFLGGGDASAAKVKGRQKEPSHRAPSLSPSIAGGEVGCGIRFGEELRTSYVDIDDEYAEAPWSDVHVPEVAGSGEGIEGGRGVADEVKESRSHEGEDADKIAHLARVRDERRARLRDDYGFDCDCPRCAEGR